MKIKRLLALITTIMMFTSMLSGVVYAEGEATVSYPGTEDLFDSTTEEGFTFATNSGVSVDGNPYTLSYSTMYNGSFVNSSTNGLEVMLMANVNNSRCNSNAHTHPYYTITAPEGKVITSYSVAVAGPGAGYASVTCENTGEVWDGVEWRGIAPNLYVYDELTGTYNSEAVKTNVTYTKASDLASDHPAKYDETNITVNGTSIESRGLYAEWTGLSAKAIKLTLPKSDTGGDIKYQAYGLQTINYADAPKGKMSVSIADSDDVPPTNELRVLFGGTLDTAVVTKDMFTIDNATVKSISFEENNTVCVLKLDTPLLRNKSYTLNISEDVVVVEDLDLATHVIHFTAGSSVGSVTVTEYNNDFSNVYEKSPGVTCANYRNDPENPDPMEFGVGPGESPSYVVYHNQGNILTSFSFYTTFSGSYILDREFKFAVSDDGETYEDLVLDTHYTFKWCNDRQYPSYNWGNNKYFYSTELPSGVKYLKVIFPTTSSSAEAKEVTLGDGEMVWLVKDEAMVLDGTAHPLSNKVKIEFNENIDSRTVSASAFTVPGYTVQSASVSGNTVTLTLNKNLESASMYTVTIGDGVKKMSGEVISEDYRKLAFCTPATVDNGYEYVRNVAIGDGGMSTGFVVHPLDPDLVYLRTDVGGMYRWDADARYWEPLTDVSDADLDFKKGTHSIAVDPTDVNVVYAAIGQQSYKYGGVYKSNDQGTTWTKLTGFPDTPFGANSNGRMGSGESMLVDPNNTNIIYCGTPYYGLWISRDKGNTWAQATGIPTGSAGTPSNGDKELSHNGVRVVAIDNLTGYVYAGVTQKGVYESKDQGASWSLMSDSPDCPSDIYAIDGKLYVSNGVGNETSGISKDRGMYVYNGSSWTYDVPDALKNTSSSKSSRAWYDDFDWSDWFGGGGSSSSATYGASGRLTVMKTSDGRIVKAVSGIKGSNNTYGHLLYVKVDDGEWELKTPESNSDKTREDIGEYLSWQNESKNIFGYSLTALEFSGKNEGELWIATGKGVFKIENVFDTTQKFVAETNGIELTCVECVRAMPESSEAEVFVGTMDFGPFRVTDTTDHTGTTTLPEISLSTWYSMTRTMAYCHNYPDYVARVSSEYNGMTSPYVAVSENNGKRSTWDVKGWTTSSDYRDGAVALSSGLNANGVPDMIALVNNASGSALSDVTKTVAKYSADFGETWNDISGLPEKMLLGLGNIVTADRAVNGKFYVYDMSTGIVYISTDGGKNFTAGGTASAFSSESKRAVIVSNPYVGGELLVGAVGNGLYKSTDGGLSFTKMDKVTNVFGVDFGASAPGRTNATVFVLGYVNDEYGLYRSDDGVNYVRINDPERNSVGWVPYMISADPSTYGKVYVTTQGRGVFEFSLKSEIPETYIDAESSSAYVYENSLLNEKLVLYAATYNSDGSLKSVNMSESKFIDKYGKLVVDVAEPESGETVRYFLWSEGTLTPLTESR